jgi:hypothetical protein
LALPLKPFTSLSAIAGQDRSWPHFASTFLRTFFGGLLLVYLVVFLSDPFDSGRSPISIARGVADHDARFSNASNARDPDFDSAIFGNSHGQALDPHRLSQLTGHRFLQLTVPGTGPLEQLTLLRWFLAHHAEPAYAVFVVDDWWCDFNPQAPVRYSFPFWLYDGWTAYLPRLLSPYAMDRGARRIGLALGLLSRIDPANFDDYEIGKTWAFHPGDALEDRSPQASSRPMTIAFPAIDRLRVALAGQPALPLVILMTPVYRTAIPRPGSVRNERVNACKSAFARLAGAQPHGVFLDFRVDGDFAHDPHNFMDATHYRSNVARWLEDRIAEGLRRAAAR